jgi:ABC-type antimicrobial peptide transport system permease subunit
VLSYAVNERAPEIGVRMALGARPAAVARGVVEEALALAAIGVGAGVALALVLTRLMRSLLHEVAPGDPPTMAAAAAALLAVALVASWLPARRAASLDPAVALRHE